MSSYMQIFISYARQDIDLAKLLADVLRKHNVEVWLDVESLRSKDPISQTIEKAISRANFVIVLWSKKSIESKWVRAESSLAWDQEKLYSIIIEDAVKPPLPFNNNHALNFVYWGGNLDYYPLKQLFKDISVKIDSQSPSIPVLDSVFLKSKLVKTNFGTRFTFKLNKRLFGRLISVLILLAVLLIIYIGTIGHLEGSVDSSHLAQHFPIMASIGILLYLVLSFFPFGDGLEGGGEISDLDVSTEISEQSENSFVKSQFPSNSYQGGRADSQNMSFDENHDTDNLDKNAKTQHTNKHIAKKELSKQAFGTTRIRGKDSSLVSTKGLHLILDTLLSFLSPRTFSFFLGVYGFVGYIIFNLLEEKDSAFVVAVIFGVVFGYVLSQLLTVFQTWVISKMSTEPSKGKSLEWYSGQSGIVIANITPDIVGRIRLDNNKVSYPAMADEIIFLDDRVTVVGVFRGNKMQRSSILIVKKL